MFPPDPPPGALVPSNGLRLATDDLNREANHRIANNLSAIAGLVRLHAAEVASRRADLFSGADVRSMLDEIGSRIETVGRLHRLLSDAPPGEEINLAVHLTETAEALVSSLSRGDLISLSCDGVENCYIDPDQAAPVALIVNELVTNAIKHSHPAGAPGNIMVRCGVGLGGSLYVEVEDDGVGLPEDFDPRTDGSLGFQVVRGLADQLGARLVFDGDGIGLRVRLMVPVRALEAA